MQRLLVRGDAILLIVMGIFGLTADLVSFAAGAGPFGAAFHRDPQVIGVVEAHGLAVLIGMGAWFAGRINPPRFLHWQLALTHALLGSANVAFFDVFLDVGARTPGMVVTAAHFLLVLLQVRAATRPRYPALDQVRRRDFQ